jgi:hypothetical protein
VSIIYEALKKTQRSREIKNHVARENKYPARLIERLSIRTPYRVNLALGGIILTLTVLVLGGHVANAFHHDAEVVKPQSVPVATAVIEEPVPAKHMVLKGVLLSDQDKMALINNQPYHVGDVVEGMKIVSIEFNSVILRQGDRKLVLRTAS